MSDTQTAPAITNELARASFTDKMLSDMRALIGTELRTEACLNNEYATRLAIMRFCEGIGDDNPLWTDRGVRGGRAVRDAGRAAVVHLRVPGIGAGRLAWAGWVSRRDEDELQPADSRGRQDHREGGVRRLRRARSRIAASAAVGSRITCARSTAIRTGSSSPRSSARGCASSAARCRSVRRDAPSSCRIRGRMRSSPRSRKTCWRSRRAGRTRGIGKTCRWVMRSTGSPRGRWG